MYMTPHTYHSAYYYCAVHLYVVPKLPPIPTAVQLTVIHSMTLHSIQRCGLARRAANKVAERGDDVTAAADPGPPCRRVCIVLT